MVSVLKTFIFLALLILYVSAEHNIQKRQARSCRAPDGRQGRCIQLSQCQSLRRLSSSRRANDVRFIRNSICSYDGVRPMVCCPSSSTSTRRPRITTLSTEFRRPNGGRPMSYRNEEGCGIGGNPDGKIINGQAASLNSWPWMAALYDEQFGSVFFRCGGSLINRQYVLTAAHCVADRFGPIPASKYTVRLGDLNLASSDDGATPIEVGVSDIKIYEEYDYRAREPVLHDIALLRLSQPVTFTQGIRPICIPGPEYDNVGVFEGKVPVVTGWGKTETSSDDDVQFSDILRQVHLPIQSQANCQSVYPTLPIGPTHICAGLAQGGKDSCQGDSGGPMMLTDFLRTSPRNRIPPYLLIGIVSTGAKCATPGFFGIYTRVTAYRDWIQRNMV